MRLTIVADTSALLSLALSGLFDTCQKHFRIIAGETVAEELKEVSSRQDELGIAAKEILGSIEIVPQDKKFDKGENESLELLAKTKSDVLVSDDIEFVKKHRNNEKISFSIILFGILLEKKIITKRDFLNAVDTMFKKREWEENLIYLVAKNMLEEE